MTKQISAEELDRVFDEGEEDVLQYFDTDNPKQPNLGSKRVNVDFPLWMVNALDREARRIGVGRQAVIKTWIAERLDAEARRSA
ncbi:type II toxin-antitoxin system BrnA family antitoxin [Arabiibacter massiliensis]|uniref:type II toxin-antitoxin system BrnA family antitoxin n=1 Tax=Arabiibacter massiliensis TaxID=1870985 RepID=UPI0009B93F41|nr:CopG family transcriptional regulator [Arabiibacter massiliensis]